ncbi:DUF4167 domain-containing protein [Hoeflea sp. WL0058]|uniref:DUF4167 domain-containing protein n=1 Tax=Flavimaribacter sediminis TaxID=2865987 RepID=A0AAE3D4G6_9HYPH|nr:DUF4167 domain-containing protein [Flavimaribacter sediminis]MBW8640823.1 DUF4167 domain-containing protein [Flavimaribacter sediminis]
MRSGQQNKRGRGRNNNNNNNSGRKNGNPLSRSYDSNGPDVKIRGTAQHIADKYATMARDALASGDTVMGENYLQHAEHYNRIIIAAQAQIQERSMREDRDNSEREQPPVNQASGNDQPSPEPQEVNGSHPPVMGSGPQPVIEGTPMEISMEEESAQQQVRKTPLRRRAARPKRARNGNGNGAHSEDEAASAASNGADSGESSEQENAAPASKSGAGEQATAAPTEA